MIYIIVLLSMFFCHIIDDFYLQGILAEMKQKQYWLQYHYKMYKYDYIMALVIHAFSWTFMIHIPILTLILTNHITIPVQLFIVFLINVIIHSFIDNMKANLKLINLVEDQLIHFSQIIITWITYMCIIVPQLEV